MAYILGAVTLKNPTEFTRTQVEISAENTSITGRSTKDIFKRKEQFVLMWDSLTQAQVAEILSEYNLQETRSFRVTETSLTIAATDVHIDLPERLYHKGADYREGMELILTEVL